MMSEMQRRSKILRRISTIPAEKLNEIDEFLAQLDTTVRRENKVLAYSGSWADIDEDLYSDLTENLISNRKRNRNRIDA